MTIFDGARDHDSPTPVIDAIVTFLGGAFFSALLACAFVFAASIRW